MALRTSALLATLLAVALVFLALVTAAPSAADPSCDVTLTSGASSIEAQANVSNNQVVCLGTAYFKESGDAVIRIVKDNITVQPAPSSYPIVCGRPDMRATTGTTWSSSITMDGNCIVYFNGASVYNKTAAARGTCATGVTPCTDAEKFKDLDSTFETAMRSSGHAYLSPANSDRRVNEVDGTNIATRQSRDGEGECNGVTWSNPAQPWRIDVDQNVPIVDGANTATANDENAIFFDPVAQHSYEFWEVDAASPRALPSSSFPYVYACSGNEWDTSINSTGSAGTLGGSHATARGSGMGLMHTVPRGVEFEYGINHPITLTVSCVRDSAAISPAVKDDGCGSTDPWVYGMLVRLKPSWTWPSGVTTPTQGQITLVDALKKYGAYITDKGSSMEIEASRSGISCSGCAHGGDLAYYQAAFGGSGSTDNAGSRVDDLNLTPADFDLVCTSGTVSFSSPAPLGCGS